MHTKVVTFATVVCLMGMMGMMASADAAKKQPRGTPGSSDRAKWCAERQKACDLRGEEYCREQEKSKPGTYNLCVHSSYDSCEHSWGIFSTCGIDARTSPPGGVVKPPVLPGVLEPVKPTPRPDPYAPLGRVYQRGVEGEPAPTAPTGPEEKVPATK